MLNNLSDNVGLSNRSCSADRPGEALGSAVRVTDASRSNLGVGHLPTAPCITPEKLPRGTRAAADRHRQRQQKERECELRVMQLNCRGLRGKAVELSKRLPSEDVDLVLLSETLLYGKSCSISGYTLYQCSCATTCRGTAVLARRGLNCLVKPRVSQGTGGNGTCALTATVWKSGRQFTVIPVYNRPHTTCDVAVDQSLSFKATIIAGDFNACGPRWGYMNPKVYNAAARYVEELSDTSNLQVLQTADSPPTLLHSAHGTESRPDLTLVSADLAPRIEWEVLKNGVGSDHLPILLRVKLEGPNTAKCPRGRYNFGKANWDTYRRVANAELSAVDMNAGLDSVYGEMCSAILKAAKQAIPFGARKRYSPFWNAELAKAVRERNKARSRASRTKKPVDRAVYNRKSAEVTRLSLKAKRAKWVATCDSLNLRDDGDKAWRLLRSLDGLTSRTNPTPIVNTRGGLAVSDGQKANVLNNQFASVNKAVSRPKLDRHIGKIRRQLESGGARAVRRRVESPLFDSPFAESELRAALSKCKKKGAPGPDGIHYAMIKNLDSSSLAKVLDFINRTWTEGTLPKAWKIATITPIPKKDKDPQSPASYRPISLTSCLGKLAERMINARLVWFLEKNGLLDSRQAGFRRGMQTTDQLIRFIQSAADGFQSGEHTAAVFVDLQQAYDRVWRSGLLLKLQRLGVDSRMYEWLKSFLSDRVVQTKVGAALSSKRTLEDGLPQGSCLSCTLFLVFINDLARNIRSETALFADDLVIWNTGPGLDEIESQLKADLLTIGAFCSFWKLKVNTSKTEYCIFSLGKEAPKRKLRLSLSGELVAYNPAPRYLGVDLDVQLTMSGQVKRVVNQALSRFKLVQRLASTSWGATAKLLKTLYTGYIRSMVDYSLPTLATASESSMLCLERLQNRAIRFVCGAMKSTPPEACLVQAGVEPIRIRQDRAIVAQYERIKRLDRSHPLRKMTDTWEGKRRIQKSSFLREAERLRPQYNMPTHRAPISLYPAAPPYETPPSPAVATALCDPRLSRHSNVTVLKAAALETIASYPSTAIRAYTDGSATNATVNAGFGAVVFYPSQQQVPKDELFGPCGSNCSNYDAELIAIREALDTVRKRFLDESIVPADVVVFSDSLSALDAIRGNSATKTTGLVEAIVALSHRTSQASGRDVYFQWIPAHVGIPGNEIADSLAKRGAASAQEGPGTAVSLAAAQSLARSVSKTHWLQQWAASDKGRSFYQFAPKPDLSDGWNRLSRRDQCAIFRMRTGHAEVNGHLNRINPLRPPNCRHCACPNESVSHLLLECPGLSDARSRWLPAQPTIEGCLFGPATQLRSSACFFRHATKDS